MAIKAGNDPSFKHLKELYWGHIVLPLWIEQQGVGLMEVEMNGAN